MKKISQKQMLSSLVSFLKRGLFGFKDSASFPYSYKFFDPALLIDPVVTLFLSTNGGPVAVKFLVDSGSDTTVLPESFAPILDIDLTQIQPVHLEGVGGNFIDAFPAKINLTITDSVISVNCLFIEGPQTPLLGRRDIWDKFSITFDNQSQKTVFKEL